jgi:peptidoglycan L-alanyl-D-glutamate endopeptidase CwlK
MGLDIGRLLRDVTGVVNEVNKVVKLPPEVIEGLEVAASLTPVGTIAVAAVKAATRDDDKKQQDTDGMPTDSVWKQQADPTRREAVRHTEVTITRGNGFKLGEASRKELQGVYTPLIRVVQLAIQLTRQDFCVYDGIRSFKEQQQHVANGTSKTMKSKHLDGLAVDLVPWINGKPVWDWKGCYMIAHAMDQAATQLGVANKIRWGGAWDRVLSDFGGDLGSYEQEVQRYQSRHPGPDFIDGPHFEWVD